jgi:hypothetical protein
MPTVILYSQLRQFLASFFLFVTLVGIATDLSPTLCCADELNQLEIMQSGVGAGPPLVVDAAAMPQQRSANCFEDCVCCCSHVIVSARIIPHLTWADFGAARVPSRVSLENSASSAFRPPRSV